METITTDKLDEQLIHALRLDPRVPFARFATLTGVSEQTVARRFRRLQAAGAVRVVGLVDPDALGLAGWTVRIRARPDAAVALADALTRRPDVGWVSLTSGGTEILCSARSTAGIGGPGDPGQDSSQELLLRALPHTKEVIDFSAQMILHRFPERLGSIGDLAELDAAQVEEVRGRALRRPAGPEPVTAPAIGPEDDALLAEVRQDGRAPVARLAQVTGWGPARVQRRLEELVGSGLLYFDTEMAVEALGFATQATIWLSVSPADLDRVGRELTEHKEICYLAAATGTSNLTGTIACRNPGHLYRYVTQGLGGIPAIRHVEISPILRRLKQKGSMMREGLLTGPAGGLGFSGRS